MTLTLEADSCTWKNPCPRIYGIDRHMIIVQGKRLDSATTDHLHLLRGQDAVEYPCWSALDWVRFQAVQPPLEAHNVGWRKISETGRGTIIVQGKRLDPNTRALLNIPDDEDAVEYPRQLALEWATSHATETATP